MSRWWLCLLVVALASAPACKSSSKDSDETEQDDDAVAEKKPSAQKPSAQKPSGSREKKSADKRRETGRSCKEPPQSELAVVNKALDARDHDAATKALALLEKQYPRSIMVSARAAGLALHAKPSRTKQARALYTKVLELEKQGCKLDDRNRWSTLLGIGLSHMFDGDFDKAVPPLEKTVKAYPRSATTRYNLACAYCRSGNVDACHRELEATLEAAASKQPPKVEKANKPAAHYVALAKNDADLAKLREDPRFDTLLARF